MELALELVVELVPELELALALEVELPLQQRHRLVMCHRCTNRLSATLVRVQPKRKVLQAQSRNCARSSPSTVLCRPVARVAQPLGAWLCALRRSRPSSATWRHGSRMPRLQPQPSPITPKKR